MNKKLAYLDMIQGIIGRLSSYQFLLKGWAVTLVVGILVFLIQDANRRFVLLAILPIFTFWGLDGYFLWQERRYRALYADARTIKIRDITFSTNIRPYKKSWLGAVFSMASCPFYLALVVAIIGVLCLA
ncbi:MAG: hypothetical protein M1596_04185 [Firmicutes bacterium]|nr:hypothetical protein [Bacillota bacterium]